jgi:N-carbamoyl-L-amino-acid hydrolase
MGDPGRGIPRQVNAARLQQSLEQLAAIGTTPGGGVTRLALSDEDRAGRDLLCRWLAEAGLTLRVDDFGNVTGQRVGRATGPPVRLGSHCDTVRRGGRYDGALGVLAALEVVRTLNDRGVVTRRPLEVVNWTNEEGARFEPAMICSGAVAGVFARDWVYDRRDAAGLRFEDELRRIGYLGSAEHRPGPAAAYLELHIEQGPALEAAGQPVGVVEGIVGITWLEVTLAGQADHAGPTPMPRRRDALLVAARTIVAINQLVRAQDDRAVGTVGRLALEPNVINVIPGNVVFSVDLRHPDGGVLEALAAEVAAAVAAIAEETDVRATVNRFWTSEPTAFDPALVQAVQATADDLGLPSQRLWSAAGHDAKYMADVCPTAMIFVRSQGGLSHCEQEYSTPEDIAAGANVLLGTALRIAEG